MIWSEGAESDPDMMGQTMLQIVVLIVLTIVATGVLYAIAAALHHAFALVEYRARQQPCPRCGRSCYGVRHRSHVGDRWGGWHSPCCGVALETENMTSHEHDANHTNGD